MCTWQENPDLIERLTSVQNHKTFAYQNILLFAGMYSDRSELMLHVETCERRAGIHADQIVRFTPVPHFAAGDLMIKDGRTNMVWNIVKAWGCHRETVAKDLTEEQMKAFMARVA